MMRYWFLMLLMLCSGLAGISYEVLYARLLSNLIGDQFVVSASVLMTFLLGIGWGSLLAHRFWRWLWLIEALIGGYAMMMVWSQSWIEMLLYASPVPFLHGLPVSVTMGVLLLLLPAMLIGCSVPLFSSWLSHAQHDQRAAFSQVYMVYNVGAVLTALAIEFWLIRWLGIHDTVLLFAAINIFVAISLLVAYRDIRDQGSGIREQQGVLAPLRSLRGQQIWPLLALSVASAVLQLFMMKYAELVFGPFRENFALVLSIVLMGIVIGAMLARYLQWPLSRWMALAFVGVLWLLLAAGPAIYVYAALYALIQPWYVVAVFGKWLVLCGLMLLPVVAFGAAIPALLLHQQEVSQESGALLFVSACANAAGFLLMVLVLHPLLDYGVQLLLVLALVLLAWLLSPVGQQWHPDWRKTLLAMSVLLCGWVSFHWWWDEDLLYLSYTNYQDIEDLRDARSTVSFPDRYKGYQDVFSINWMDGKPYFFINGYISIPLNNSSEKVVGAISSMYAPDLKKAMVLGLGSGATASTVGLFFDHTDVIEINSVVRDNLYRMAEWNYDIEHNPRVKITVDDAIHAMKAGGEHYNLILNTVTTPLYFSSSKLYTTDFLVSVKRRLNRDGIYVTWMDSRIGDEGAQIILRTMKTQFRHCALLYIKSAYFLLIGSDAPLMAHQRQVVVNNERLRRDMMERYNIVSDWLPYQLLISDAYRLIDEGNAVINSVDHPELEYAMAHLRSKGIDRLKRRLVEKMRMSDIRQTLTGEINEAFPADAVLHARQKIRRSMLYRRLEQLARAEGAYPLRLKQAELQRRKVRAEVFDTARAWHRYGYQLMQLKRYAAAVKVFDRVLAMDHDYNDANYNRGVSLERLGKDDAALAAFAAELVVDAGDVDAMYRRGRLLWRQHRYADAHAQFAQAADNERAPRNLYYYDALCLNAMEKKQQARQQMARYLTRGGLPEDSLTALSRL